MEKWISLLWTIGPPLLAALYPGSRLTSILLAAMAAAEQAGGSGPEKKARALELAAAGAGAMNVAGVDPPISGADVMKDAEPAIDAMVRTINTWLHAERGSGWM